MAQSKPLYLGNAYLVRQELRVYNPATNAWDPWTGVPATVRFCSDPEGTTTIAGPYPLVMSGVDGVWYYSVSEAVVATLGDAGEIVYQVVEGGTFNELTDVVPLLITNPRYVS